MMCEWNKTKLADILTESKISVEKNREDIYKRLSVKLHLNGVHKREVRDNDNIGKTRYYERKAGQFIYGKQNLHNGAVGIIPNCLDGYQSSSDIPTFDISNSINSKWLLYYFSRKHFYKGLERLSTGTGSKRINPKNLLELSINIPPLKEQRKIAAILSSVDEAIEKTEQIIEQTERVKKGLMQELLTKGIGHTEFQDSPIGKIPKEWSIKSLSEVLKVQGGYAFKSKDAVDKGIPWFKIANVSIGQTNWSDRSYLPMDFKDIYHSYVLKAGDIVMAMTRPILSNQTKVVKLDDSDVPALLNQRVCRFIFENQESGDYLYHVFRSRYFSNEILLKIAGTDPPNVSSKQIESIIIPYPTAIEQKKIVKVLNKYDASLNTEMNKLKKLTILKHGLMQELLTGKKRVKVDDSEEVLS